MHEDRKKKNEEQVGASGNVEEMGKALGLRPTVGVQRLIR